MVFPDSTVNSDCGATRKKQYNRRAPRGTAPPELYSQSNQRNTVRSDTVRRSMQENDSTDSAHKQSTRQNSTALALFSVRWCLLCLNRFLQSHWELQVQNTATTAQWRCNTAKYCLSELADCLIFEYSDENTCARRRSAQQPVAHTHAPTRIHRQLLRQKIHNGLTANTADTSPWWPSRFR